MLKFLFFIIIDRFGTFFSWLFRCFEVKIWMWQLDKIEIKLKLLFEFEEGLFILVLLCIFIEDLM